MDPITSFSGLASGFNFRDLVDAVIQVESRPVERARQVISAADARESALGSYRGLLVTLRDALTALRDGSAFDALSTTVSGEASGGRPLLSASAASTVTPGNFQIEITTLAAAEKRGSLAQADSTTALGVAGDVTVNGQTVAVTTDDSLATIRDRINVLNTGATPTGVSASILTVGAGDARLILTSTTPGAAGIALADTTGTVLGTLGLLDPGSILTAGSDAQFSIDGVALTRTTNTVTDAIEGLTLTLATAEPGTVATVSVTRFTGEATAAASTFVQAYNAVVDFHAQQQLNGALRTDATLRASRSEFSRQLLGILTGDGGATTGATALGFSLTQSGTLAVDTITLDGALQNGFTDIKALFADSTAAADFETALDDLLRSGTGTLDIKTTALDGLRTSQQARVERLQSRLDRREESLLRQFSRMEATIGRLQSQSTFLQAQLPSLGGAR